MKQARYIDRDLSWLMFNDRVIEEAANERLPLFERLRFLTIAAANLDEFVTVRVAGLIDEIWDKNQTDKHRSETLALVLKQIMESITQQTQRQQKIWRGLRDLLRDTADIHVLNRDEAFALSDKESAALKTVFLEQIFPLLTPIAVDPSHNFPFLPNKAIATYYEMKTAKGKTIHQVVPLPSHLPRLIALPDGEGNAKRFVLLEHSVRLNLDVLLPDMEVVDFTTFRLLRDAELEMDHSAENLAQGMEKALQSRRRGEVILMTLNTRASVEQGAFLQRHIGVDDGEIVKIDGIMGLSDLRMLMDLARLQDLYPPHHIRYPERVKEWDGDIFSAIVQKDFVVHHPYESFDVVVGLLQQAARDPQVRTIKQTLYRTSSDSPIVGALIEAAHNGKSVTAVIELQARFDEEANLRWARDMERAGVYVVFGTIGLKIHAKLTLVARVEGSQIRTFCHLGTGNYHPHTARIYTDLSLFTDDAAIGKDVVRIFNYMTGNAEPHDLEKLAISPLTLRSTIMSLIEDEIAHAKEGRPAAIWLKANALEDESVIDKLYEASQAGVKIEASIRGICRLRPGVKGLSENIRVKSIVGRFLEHARIYAFGNGYGLPSKQAKVFMSSADLMHRNLSRRVETLVPLENTTVHNQVLNQIMLANFKDNTQSWNLTAEGHYERAAPGGVIFSAHEYFMRNPSLSGRGKASHLPPSLEETQ